MPRNPEAAFAVAVVLCVLLYTTAVVVVILTGLVFVGGDPGLLLQVTWGILGMSSVWGLLLLGNLASLLNSGRPLDLYGLETRVLAVSQGLFFALGIVTLVVSRVS